MVTVGITGIDGLIGWHLRAFLHAKKNVEVIGAGREVLGSAEALAKFASSCDCIVHLAGRNRGDEKEVAQTNVALTRALLRACDAASSRAHIIFSSSVHIFRNSSYGESKKACAELIQDWALKRGAGFTNLILPNIFGEGGKPFYNSAVSTFCFQLANRQEPKIIEDNEIEILHAQRVAQEIFSIITAGPRGEVILPGARVKVGQLLLKLKDMAGSYDAHVMPDIRLFHELDLFNTYRSYLFPGKYPVAIPVRADSRGGIMEAIKTLSGGQTFLSTTQPGVTRGEHYHTRKIERFVVFKGQARIRIRKLFSRDIAEFTVSGSQPCYIDIPTLHAHNITNIGKEELITVFWAHEIYDPENSDTYREAV